MSILDGLLLAPLVGFVLLLFLPKTNREAIRNVALGLSGVVFGLALTALLTFLQINRPGEYNHVTDILWIEYPAIHYHVGVDGISIWLVMLTALLTPLAILVSWHQIEQRAKEFYAMMLLLEFALIGVFCSLDLFLFYVFYELTLIPMIFMIGIWGGGRRMAAAVKFFLYTLGGSLLMLGSMLYLYSKANTFDLVTLESQIQAGHLMFTRPEGLLLFTGFLIAFAIKLGLFPLHTWLPDAYAEGPTGGTLMLAAVMSKMGTYGLIRVALPLFPAAARLLAPLVITLAITGIIYGALIAIIQPNIKRLIAYSSVSHIGFIVLGIFSFNQIGFDGSVYQMLNHGISTGALFLMAGFLYERRNSLEIVDLGGIATRVPNLATVFLIATLASIGLPVLNNFVGEFLILQGAAQANYKYAIFAAIGVVLSACYMLWMYQRTFLGKANPETDGFTDLNSREWGIVIPLIVLMVWMGTATQTFLPSISTANAHVLEQTERNVDVQVKHETPTVHPIAEVAHAR